MIFNGRKIKPSKPHKYGVCAPEDRTYGISKDGKPVVYHSAMEAERARELDLLLRCGPEQLEGWERQVRFEFGPVPYVCVLDFVCRRRDVSGLQDKWGEQVTGMKKSRDAEILRFWRVYGPFPLFVYSERRGVKWLKIERVEGAHRGGDDGEG